MRLVLQSLSNRFAVSYRIIAATNLPEIDEWQPDDPEDFVMPFDAYVGTPESGTSDCFSGVVCSPRWLDRGEWDEFLDYAIPTPGTLLGHGLIIQRRWSYEDLWATVESLCQEAEAPTFTALARRLDRHLGWESTYRVEEEEGVVESDD